MGNLLITFALIIIMALETIIIVINEIILVINISIKCNSNIKKISFKVKSIIIILITLKVMKILINIYIF